MHWAVRAVEGADRIALFLSEEDFASDNVWTCMDGTCAATRSLRSTVTGNLLQLPHETDLARGDVVYGMIGAYVVVNARENPIQVIEATGAASFICEGSLP
jgi:hypothetical protein